MLTNPGQKSVQLALEAHIHFVSVESFSSDLIYLFIKLAKILLGREKKGLQHFPVE